MERSISLGFSLEEDKFDIKESKWKSFHKGKEKGRRIDILSVTFEGELKVTEAETFHELLINGIGRGKAYGMGLMTVIRR